jgi:hypothetical protein
MLPTVVTKALSRQDAKRAKKEFVYFSEPWRPLRLCASHRFSDLLFIQNVKYLWLVFSQLATLNSIRGGAQCETSVCKTKWWSSPAGVELWEVRSPFPAEKVKAIAVAADVSQDDQVAKAVAEVVKHFGTIDVLVNAPLRVSPHR